MRATRQAFSLVEMLATVFIFLLVLGVSMNLLNDYALAINYARGKQAALGFVQAALLTLTEEIRSSTVVSSPTTATATSTLAFWRVDPNATWMPLPNTFPVWNPLNPATQLSIRYFASGGQLLREVSPASGGPWVQCVMSDSVAGFSVLRLPDRRIQIQVLIEEAQGRTQLLTQQVVRPIP